MKEQVQLNEVSALSLFKLSNCSGKRLHECSHTGEVKNGYYGYNKVALLCYPPMFRMPQ